MALKYKAGDQVRIKSIDWYKENKDTDGKVWTSGGQIPFDKCMSEWCGKVMTISHVRVDHYTMVEDLVGYWSDEMIEGLVEEDNTDCEKCGLTRNSTRCLFMDNCLYNKQKNIIEIPKDYVLKDENGNVINATKIVLEKKKKEYPKTYEECLKIIGIKLSDCYIQGYKSILLEDLQDLLICRDAYWKLYGEEMGLGKPWNSVYGCGEWGYWIGYDINANKIYCQDSRILFNRLLVFPTEKMRDAFYENFKEEIEICKELL